MTKTALYSFLALTTVALYLLTHFTLNGTASEPIGFYRITNKPLARDALVLLKDPLKRLVGVPGDEIRMAPKGVYVNGQLIPNSAVPPGSPYPHYQYGSFKLGPDQYFVLGNHPRSWDGRYEGPIPGSLIASTVQPFWTKQ
jgi:type IV secretory pathway protease TraF